MEDDRYTRITLRIPTDLHQKLQKSAERASHSQNAEIVARLAASYSAAAKADQQHLAELADQIADKVVARLSHSKN